MYKYNEKILNDIIKFLEKLKGEKIEFNIVPPHIEEIYGTAGGECYGKMTMDIHIEFDGLYKQISEITDYWEKANKE